jgi:hypothetical protein
MCCRGWTGCETSFLATWKVHAESDHSSRQRPYNCLKAEQLRTLTMKCNSAAQSVPWQPRKSLFIPFKLLVWHCLQQH